jgi:hypothetical protein
LTLQTAWQIELQVRRGLKSKHPNSLYSLL